jgi:heptosyltransferase II
VKILIIKLGLSETLDAEIGRVSSLGDILRTTPILYALKERYTNSNITWVVDEAGFPLLHGNTMINRILVWDSFVGFQLLSESFDIVINLEKIGGLCAITNKINAWKKYGFRFDELSGEYRVFEGSEYALDLCTKHDTKKNNDKTWQQVLVEMIGSLWETQPYSLGYQPKSKPAYDIGFNYKVGIKFPEKAWDDDNWKSLEQKIMAQNKTVSWQEGLANLYEYMDWIHSCKLLVTSDSLGLHIALAFGIPTVALFGPTNSKEVYFYGDSRVIQSEKMSEISVEAVFEALESIWLKC